jgi:hypothetical protein
VRSNKHRKAKTSFKITKPFILLISFIVVVIIATGLLSIESKEDKLYKKITNAQSALENFSGTTLEEDNVFTEITYKKLTSKIKSSDYTFVYYGTLTNEDYLTYIQTVNARAQVYDVSRVYLLDSTWASSIDTDDEDFGEENENTLTEVEKALDNVDMTIAPSLWVFKDSKVVFNSNDYLNDTYQKCPWNYVIEQAFGKFSSSKD